MPAQDPRPADPATAPRRTTKRQRALLALLARDDRFRSAQQLHAELRVGSPISVGLTSVYRNLHRLTEQQVVETQRAEDGELLYRLRRTDTHHHNLLCRTCGRAEQFTLDEVEQYADLIARQHHYRDLSHRLDLYGTCPRCAT